MTRPSYTVLGGLGAQIDAAAVELGTRKQRMTLAQLILAEGAPVSADRLIVGVWGDAPPDRAEVSLQAYISGLRKALEPDRKPRAPSTVLLTHGSGYSLPTDDDQVDVRHLVTRITRARELLRHDDPAGAAALLREVLADYRPLLPEFEGLGFRDEAAAHLERLVDAARELSFEARMAIGDHRLLLSELEQALQRSPLDEGLWVLLATARYRLGRQSDALGAIAEARRILADEIGVDPGPRLRQLERDILDHAPHLDAPVSSTPSPATQSRDSAVPTAQPDDAEGDAAATPAASNLVGRTDELAALHRAVLMSLAGPGGVVVVEGEPGAGKTALIDEAAKRALHAADLSVLWGRCVEDVAAPSMWPWVQILSSVLARLDPDDLPVLLDSDLGRMVTQGANVIPPPREMPDAAARFQFYDQAADLLDQVAQRRQLIIVLDDLQWADGASLELFAHMANRRTSGVTFFASVRSAASLRPVVEQTLATLARLPEHRRLEVGALGADDISELIRRETREWPTVNTVDSIAKRTGGNAFFVRELALILADRGSIADNAVPSGVRDVVRQRVRDMPTDTATLLDVAASIGSRVDVALLADAAGREIDGTLESLEVATAAGVIESDPDDPFGFSFTHDLIREAIVAGIGSVRSRRIHLAVADALDRTGSPNRITRVARHLWAAGPLADRARTSAALLAAGQLNLRTYDFEGAVRNLTDSSTLARAIGDEQAEMSAITMRLAADVAQNGYFSADHALTERARELAERLGDERLLANLDYARCAAHLQIADVATGHRLAEDLRRRAQGSDDPTVVHLAMHVSAIDEFNRGNIGAAHRLLERYAPLDTDVDGIRPDQMILARGFRAWAATLHVDATTGREEFRAIDLRQTDPVGRLGVAIFAASAAAMIGDTSWAADASRRLLDASGQGPLEYLRNGGEHMYWWARAMQGDVEEALAAIDRLTTPNDQARTGAGFWYGLYAEMLVAADRLIDAGAVLAEAESFADITGERYADAHRLLVDATLQRARGADNPSISTLLTRARGVAVRQECTELVTRIDRTASSWGCSAG